MWQKNMQVTLGFIPYTLELWNSSFNAEANTRQRSQQMTLFRSSFAVKDFTPQTAQQSLPAGGHGIARGTHQKSHTGTPDRS